MRFDAAVIGGGPAGAAAALELRRRGAAVLVLERSRYEDWRAGELLAPRVRGALEGIGVWERFLGLAPAPAYAVRVAWGGPAVERSSVFAAWGHGWSVERRKFDAMLVAAAEDAGAVVRRGARVVVEGAAGAWRIGADEAGWIVDASGRTGRVARTLGARWVMHDRLVGIVARVAGGDAEPVLTIEAAEHGWWYSAPLSDGAMVVALMTDADLWTGDAASFWRACREQTEETRRRTEGLRIEDVQVRPAGSGRLAPVSGDGWIAAGDAACAWDPLSGDGVVRAIEGGVAAAAAIGGETSLVAGRVTSFERYLDTRNAYYRRESRWRDRLFWRRRQAPDPGGVRLTIDPRAPLRWDGGAGTEAEGWLAPVDVAALCGLCDGRSAGDVVRAFRGRGYGDERVIVALQRLLEVGALVTA